MAGPQNIGIKLSLDGAASVAAGLGQVQGSLGNLGTKISTVRDALGSFAPALASAFTVGGLVAFVRNTTNAIDAMNDLADATGSTIEEISKLDQVARRNGASLDSVGGMLVKFNNALKEADGKNGASIALQAIGLEAAKLRALDPSEALRQTAVALAGFADDGNKARLVQELFGKSVREAAPFLKDLAESGTLVAKVTAAQAAEAERFNKQLFAIQANSTDAARGLVGDLLPALNSTLEKVIELNKVGWFKMFGKEITAEIKSVKLALAGARLDDLAGALAKDPGNRGLQAAVNAARQDVDGLLKDSVAATQALKDLVGLAAKPDAGGGRGFINPAFAAKPPSALDIAAEQARRKAAEESAAALLKQQEAYDKLRVSIEERISAGQLELTQGEALTESQRLKIKLDQDAAAGLLKLTPAQKAVLDGKLADLSATEKQVKAEQDALKAAKAAADARTEARRAEDRAIAEFQAAETARATASLAAVNGRISSLQDEAQAAEIAGMWNISLAEALELVTIKRLRERQSQYQEGSEPYLAVQREIDARRELADLISDSATREANRRAAEDAARDWQRTADQIGQSLSDALMQGGKSAAEYLKGLFRTTVLRPIIQAIVNPFTTAIGGALGMGNAMAGTGAAGALGGAGSGFGGLLSAGASLLNGTTGSMLGLNLVNSGLGQALGLSSLQNIGGNLIAGPTGLGSLVGSGLGMAGNGFMGYGISKALSGGYSAGGAINTIAGIASMIPGIGPIAGVVGGLVNRAFGRKPKEVTETGILGSFAGGGVTGQQYQDWLKEGGWFRSDKRGTDLSAIESDMADALGAGSQAVFQQTRAFAQVLSLPAEALASITSQFKLKLTGDAKQDQAEITRLFETYGNTLASAYRAQLVPFQRAGEAISATLQRLSGLQQFSTAINEFGGIFSRVASLSVDAKEQLLGFAGGIEALLGKTQNFVANYYEETEKLGLTARAVQQQLGTLGITSELYTRADFRRLVEATDVSNEQGRQRLSQLLDIAAAFAPVGQFLEAQGGSLSLLANTAPAAGAVPSILAAATGATENATVDNLKQLVDRVTELKTALSDSIGDLRAALLDSLGGLTTATSLGSEATISTLPRLVAGIGDLTTATSLGSEATISTLPRLVAGIGDLTTATSLGSEATISTLPRLVAGIGDLTTATSLGSEAFANTVPRLVDSLGGVQTALSDGLGGVLSELSSGLDAIAQESASGALEIPGLQDGFGGLTAATNAAAGATVSTLERLITRVGDLESALVRALDKNGRTVSDSMQFSVYSPDPGWTASPGA